MPCRVQVVIATAWTLDVPADAMAGEREQDRQDREKEAEETSSASARQRALRSGARRSRSRAGTTARSRGSTDVIAMKGPHADAALYFKAWAQNESVSEPKRSRPLPTLRKEYPKSRYLKQAKPLEQEVRSNSGQPVKPGGSERRRPEALRDRALQNSDPEQAVPMLEKLLAGHRVAALKSKALFVLAQSNSPRAREVLKKIAKGNSTPDLQNRAIDYLGTQGGARAARRSREIYAVDDRRRREAAHPARVHGRRAKAIGS